MPNGIQPVGDDQRWKRAVDKELVELRKLVKILQTHGVGGNR